MSLGMPNYCYTVISYSYIVTERVMNKINTNNAEDIRFLKVIMSV